MQMWFECISPESKTSKRGEVRLSQVGGQQQQAHAMPFMASRRRVATLSFDQRRASSPTQSTEPQSAAASTPSSITSPSIHSRLPSRQSCRSTRCSISIRKSVTDTQSRRPSIATVTSFRINHGPPPSRRWSILFIVLTITQGANQSGLGGGPPGQGGDNKDKKDPKVTLPPSTFL